MPGGSNAPGPSAGQAPAPGPILGRGMEPSGEPTSKRPKVGWLDLLASLTPTIMPSAPVASPVTSVNPFCRINLANGEVGLIDLTQGHDPNQLQAMEQARPGVGIIIRYGAHLYYLMDADDL